MLVLAFQIVLWSGMQLTTMSISETLVYVALFKFFYPILLCYGMKMVVFSALTPLVGRQEGHPACKKTEWSGAGVVICLELGADLHMAQLMQLPLTISCFSKIHIGFAFLVPTHPGSPGKIAIKCVCVRACVGGV